MLCGFFFPFFVGMGRRGTVQWRRRIRTVNKKGSIMADSVNNCLMKLDINSSSFPRLNTKHL